MAEATVFVDDVVRGSLPPVCVRDGLPTGDSLQRDDEVGSRTGLGVAWLLLLAGPLGWLGLLVVAASRGGRPERLHVVLPMGEPAYRRMRSARRLRDRAVVALVAAFALAVILLASDRTTLVQLGLALVVGVGVIALGAVLIGSLRYDRESVGVTLDASRRWVTLSNVHPAFAAACASREASEPRRT
jgi:hypothetical protein